MNKIYLTLGLIIPLFVCCFLKQQTGKISHKQIKFSITDNPEIQYFFSTENSKHDLQELREKFQIEKLWQIKDSQISNVLRVMNWTHKQWDHNGSNSANSYKGIEILNEAQVGGNFRCVEYGIVLKDVLNSVGINTRLLELKVKNADIVKHSAGHVLVEIYLTEIEKWIMADGQFNLVPFKDGIPLNAVELLENLMLNKEIEFKNLDGAITERLTRKYLNFIVDYLFYFSTNIDNRYDMKKSWKTIRGKSQIMLIPIGAKKLIRFEGGPEIRTFIYTNSKRDFYKEPVELKR